MGFLETIFSCFYDKRKQKQEDEKSEKEDDIDVGDPKVISNIAQFPSVKQMRNMSTIQEEKEGDVTVDNDDDNQKRQSVDNDQDTATNDQKVDDSTVEELKKLFPELTIGFNTPEAEWNDMSQPIRCTYKEYDTSISD
ncbi:predicted protein [Chaetoceros tenuissimus]|uniref:Uncharacterized protein n=1 Tax=Chaetoceros tenuissimus TaxID=426638 RepID=A0AAD3D023_9STRA|nr:predicted protein [Chaetoceros tenuissimus]GFH55346.1 predicted protein [Chaetoceros tenuissimus]